MKKLYFIMLLLFFFSFSITAQTMQVQGHLLGDENKTWSRLPYVVIPRIQYLLQASQPI